MKNQTTKRGETTMTTMTQETMDARKAKGAGPLICGDCGKEITIGQTYQWSGRTTSTTIGNAYSHIRCQGATPRERDGRKNRNWEKSEWN